MWVSVLRDNLLLFLVSVLAGGLNSVAGGGSFLTFPMLLLTGFAPIEANATSTVALWPGSVASAAGYRRELVSDGRILFWLGIPSLLGGGAGALLLIHTPPSVFTKLIPVLLLGATVVFTFGDKIKRRLQQGTERSVALWWVAAIQLPIALYGGYFGGGMGMMMLATFALLGMDDIHHMNGLKSLLAVLINGVAIGTFIVAGRVVWSVGTLMVGGAIVGGYVGASLARRFNPQKVRRAVVAYGWLLTAYFFMRTYFAG